MKQLSPNYYRTPSDSDATIKLWVLPCRWVIRFNLDGSYDVYDLCQDFFSLSVLSCWPGVSQQIAMPLTLMITSKGIAAVPRASLVGHCRYPTPCSISRRQVGIIARHRHLSGYGKKRHECNWKCHRHGCGEQMGETVGRLTGYWWKKFGFARGRIFRKLIGITPSPIQKFLKKGIIFLSKNVLIPAEIFGKDGKIGYSIYIFAPLK